MFRRRHKFKSDVVETVDENPTVFLPPAAPEPSRNLWAEYYDAVRDLDVIWHKDRQRQIDALPKVEPYRILQDQDGWWRVSRPQVKTLGTSPSDVALNRPRALFYGSDSSVPKPKQQSVHVMWAYEDYAPTFKFFAEAKAWAEETILIGRHAFDLNDRAEIVSTTHPEGLSALGPVYQASQDAQERATERAASYEQEAMF